MGTCIKCDNEFLDINKKFTYCECEDGLFRKTYAEYEAVDISEIDVNIQIKLFEERYKMSS